MPHWIEMFGNQVKMIPPMEFKAVKVRNPRFNRVYLQDFNITSDYHGSITYSGTIETPDMRVSVEGISHEKRIEQKILWKLHLIFENHGEPTTPEVMARKIEAIKRALIAPGTQELKITFSHRAPMPALNRGLLDSWGRCNFILESAAQPRDLRPNFDYFREAYAASREVFPFQVPSYRRG